MILANEKFGIPRILSPENFASSDLDDLSAMTYLSYFVKVDSPGYFDTLNWVCQQLRTAAITNLTVIFVGINKYNMFIYRSVPKLENF